MKNKNSGFTLIELLVVVLIIGILSSIALPQYTKSVEKARAAEAVTLMKSIQQGAEEFILGNPNWADELVGCSGNSDGRCGLLSIDVEGSLTCDINGGDRCRSKTFAYDAYVDDMLWIYAFRAQDGNTDNDIQYTLEMGRSSDGTWTQGCNSWSGNFNKSICEGAFAN